MLSKTHIMSVLLLSSVTIPAYWDKESCGPNGDDANWEWCDKKEGSCQTKVHTTKCSSGIATLTHKSNSYKLNGCEFMYYATYTCRGISFQ